MRALTHRDGDSRAGVRSRVRLAWRGREEEALAVIGSAVREFTVSGEGAVLAFADYGRAVLCNGLGRYQEALTAAAATDALEDEGVTIVTEGLAELVEAAARAGAPGRAADALARLEEMTRASDTGWERACGLARRRWSAPMTRPSRSTVKRSSGSAAPVSARSSARAHLIHGEWLRRANRRADALHELLQAFEMFDGMGMEAFSGARAARAGGHRGEGQDAGRGKAARSHQRGADRPPRPRRTDERRDRLRSRPERANRGGHLRKVFTKLGITSRRQLPTAVL